jgi:hypothetical protein
MSTEGVNFPRKKQRESLKAFYRGKSACSNAQSRFLINCVRFICSYVRVPLSVSNWSPYILFFRIFLPQTELIDDFSVQHYYCLHLCYFTLIAISIVGYRLVDLSILFQIALLQISCLFLFSLYVSLQ